MILKSHCTIGEHKTLFVSHRFMQQVNSDVHRRMQLIKHLTDPSHVFSRFISGNSKSLVEGATAENVLLHEAVKVFFNDWYSANNMALSICGHESLDCLEKMVREMCSSIQSKQLPTNCFPGVKTIKIVLCRCS